MHGLSALLTIFLFNSRSLAQVLIARQGFESPEAAPVWNITAGSGNISTTTGGGFFADTPGSQRIRNGSRSWQVNNGTVSLDLATVNLAGYSDVAVTVRISSTATWTGGNGADLSDRVRVFADLDGGGFPGTPDITVTGSSANNARWSYNNAQNATTTAGTPITRAGTAGTNQGTIYSTLIVNIPDGTSTVALRVTANNNAASEVWNVDEIELQGIPCTPNVSVSPSTEICPGNSTTLTASGATDYTWSPATGLSGTTGASVTASPSSTTTYTVTGTDPGCPFSGTATTTVTITPGGPTGVIASSTETVVCAGNPTTLSASGVGTGTILSNNFNAGAGSWTVNNSLTTGGTAANRALVNWTSRANSYTYSGNTFNSNDNSAFFLANSDAGGNAVTTNTILRSPSFSTVGFTSATLTFYHHYRFNSGSELGYVEVSTDNSTWTAVATYGATVGAVNNFQLATVDLSAYDGQTTVWVRFRYSATYDWWWAIDNVAVTGTSSSALTWAWTSTPSGFTSAVKDPGVVSVGQTRTYTVTATAPNGCSASSSVAVTAVTPPDAGSDGSFTTCSNSAATDMFTQLGGTPDAGGAWSGPSPVSGGMYDPATMDPGVYTYTVSAPPCADASATITVTENTATAWYADLDGDGFGDNGSMVLACTAPLNHVADNTDCDDNLFLYVDADGDGFGTGSPVACGVPDNTDCDDNLVRYEDTDGDGFGSNVTVACGGVDNNTDDCPTVPGLIGSSCDAQPGPGFLLGQLNGSCNCVATPCTEDVVIELRSDPNSEQIGWEILDQNSPLVICSGGAPNEPYPHGITSPIAPSCCLPAGCYRLRVTDAGGDGFVSGGITGGYQLREDGVNGRRIIDNLGNFTNGSVSAIMNTYDNGAFCVPVGDDKLIFSSCDKLDWVNNKFIVATENTAVSAQYGVNNSNSGYEFWFFDPNGSYSFRRFRSHATSDGYGSGALRACHFKVNGWLNNMATPHIPSNILLNVRIRGRVNGSNLPFGAACQFKIDPVLAACPRAKLVDDPANPTDYSCGVFRNFGGASNPNNRITANPPQAVPTPPSSMVRYQFRFRIAAESICIVRPPQTSPRMVLNWTNGPALQCSKSYDVDVRVSLDGGATWCFGPPSATEAAACADTQDWGKVCKVTINACALPEGGNNSMAPTGNGDLTMYPNPNNGAQLFLNLQPGMEAPESGMSTAQLTIHDLTGKQVITRTLPVEGGMVNSRIDLNGELGSGVYMVSLTVGDRTRTARLVIQR